MRMPRSVMPHSMTPHSVLPHAVSPRRVLVALLLAALPLAACGRERAVAWQQPRALAAAIPDSAAMQLDVAGAPVFGPAPAVPIVLPAGACPRTLALAPAGNGIWYAAWWTAGARGATLQTSRSATAGASWTAPDTPGERGGPARERNARDSTGRGCARPAPALAVGPGGAVYLAYTLDARGNVGVWLASDTSGAGWSAPVRLARSRHAGGVALAVRGDTLAVAYAREPRRGGRGVGIALVLATPGGRAVAEPLEVARANAAPAVSPRVALRGATVVVAWREAGADGAGRVVVRRGTLALP